MVSFSGMGCPKEIVAGLRGPPQSSQAGALTPFLDFLLDLIPVVSLLAMQTGDMHGGAVDLDHLFRRVSSLEVEAVDILGDDAIEFFPAVPSPQWPDGRDWVEACFMGSYISVAISQYFSREAWLEMKFWKSKSSGLYRSQSPPGTSEVRDARFRAESRSRKNNDPLRNPYPFGNLFQLDFPRTFLPFLDGYDHKCPLRLRVAIRPEGLPSENLKCKS